MRDPKRIRSLAVAGLAATLLAACGGNSGTSSTASGSQAGGTTSAAPSTPADNGEAAKTGPQVAADAADALQSAGAVHVAGTGSQDGQQLGVDLQVQGNDVSGTLTLAGQPLQLISTGGKAYAKAPAAFWGSFGVPAAAQSQLDGKWVILPAEAASSLGQEFTLTGLANSLRKPSSGTINNPVTSGTLNGQKTVVVTQSDGSTLDVAATGKPYPLRLVNKGTSAGTLTLSDFGTQQAITAPAGAIDLSQLTTGG